jgi:hypothetical protein
MANESIILNELNSKLLDNKHGQLKMFMDRNICSYCRPIYVNKPMLSKAYDHYISLISTSHIRKTAFGTNRERYTTLLHNPSTYYRLLKPARGHNHTQQDTIILYYVFHTILF